jgi:hypothetical protein
MFESMKQMAKLDGEGEDKGQLNHHIILIGDPSLFDNRIRADFAFQENMSYFVTEISGLDVASLNAASRKAEAIYDENLSSYIRILVRRSFGKIIVRDLFFLLNAY